MKKWNLYVAGMGPYDRAESLLTGFVSQLRDLGLKVDDADVIRGELHPDLVANTPQGEGQEGWTMNVYGTGDLAAAYSAFPTFLTQFRDAGIEVAGSGIVQGERTQIPISA